MEAQMKNPYGISVKASPAFISEMAEDVPEQWAEWYPDEPDLNVILARRKTVLVAETREEALALIDCVSDYDDTVDGSLAGQRLNYREDLYVTPLERQHLKKRREAVHRIMDAFRRHVVETDLNLFLESFEVSDEYRQREVDNLREAMDPARRVPMGRRSLLQTYRHILTRFVDYGYVGPEAVAFAWTWTW